MFLNRRNVYSFHYKMQLATWWHLSLYIILLLAIQECLSQNSFKSTQFRLQICRGQNISEEQRQIILQSFLTAFPILGNNSSVDTIVPSIAETPSCEAGEYLRKSFGSHITELNEIETSNNEGSITTYISYKDGQLHLTSENFSFSPKQFCVSPKTDVKLMKNASVISFAIYKCQQYLASCSRERPCIRKCCGVDEAWDIKNSTCKQLQNISKSWHWDPSFYEVTDDGDCVIKLGDVDDTSESNTAEFHYDIGLPRKCGVTEEWNSIPSKNIPGEFGLGRFRMLLNGSVLMNYDNGSWVLLSHGTYCVDEILPKMHYSKNGTLKRCKRSTKVLLVCKDEYQLRGPKRPIPSQYATMLFFAATILLLIIIVYLLLWDRHSIYEWTVFFEVLSMIMMIILVAVSHSVARDPSEGYYGSKRCIFLGMATHYFFLATFFWLFIINFEIWWNFRTLTIRNRKSRKWLRLMMYHIFGCGGPGVIVLIGWLLDRKYGLQNDNIDCTSLILPNYGQLNCYISKRAQGPYLYFPIGVLLGCNLLFYFLTVFKMCQYQKHSQQISSSKTNGHFQPVVVFARLFIVMGVSWIFEIVAWAIKPSVRGRVPLYWIIFDIVTLVQAIAIFVIFVCRRDIVESLVNKYPPLQRILSPLFLIPCCKKGGQTSPGTPPNQTTLGKMSNGSNSTTPISICEQVDFDLSLKDISGQIQRPNLATPTPIHATELP